MHLLLRLVQLVGLALAAYPFWPEGWRLPALDAVPARTLQITGAALVLGAFLVRLAVRRRRRGGDGGETVVRARLAQAGFRFVELARGWQAEGPWRGERLIVRKVHDAHATRFGRPWTLLVTLPGRPREGWPFLPDEGGIVERGESSFTVVVADVAIAGRAGDLDQRLDALLAARG